jgi:pimeloyl-ACP methyl ester carboxylesterase
MTENKPPVIFIHGLWLHANSWQPWVELFESKGYRASAPGWPGDGDTVADSRLHPERIAGHGIQEVADHYAQIIGGLDEKPILIGHSFGGMLVEKLLGEDYAVAGIGIDAAQIKGVLPLPLSSLRATLPVFKNLSNKEKAVSLSAKEFHFAFGNTLSEEESDELYEKWTVPAPGKPLFEAASANFSAHSPAKVNTDNEGRGPLLLVMGGRDNTVPEAITKATVKQYRNSSAETDLVEFADRGHSLTIDHGWREVADSCLTWLGERGF